MFAALDDSSLLMSGGSMRGQETEVPVEEARSPGRLAGVLTQPGFVFVLMKVVIMHPV